MEVKVLDRSSPGFMYRMSFVPSPQWRSARTGDRVMGETASETRTPGTPPRVLAGSKKEPIVFRACGRPRAKRECVNVFQENINIDTKKCVILHN